jgi:hypothetical protein
MWVLVKNYKTLKDKQNSSKLSKKSDRTDELVLRTQTPSAYKKQRQFLSYKTQTNKQREANRQIIEA